LARRADPRRHNALQLTPRKLATDDEFRARLFENPAAATWEAGLPLSPIELEALSRLLQAAVARFSQSLDGRIRRLCVASTPSRAARTKQGRDSKRPEAGPEDAT